MAEMSKVGVAVTEPPASVSNNIPPPPSYNQATQNAFKLSYVDFAPQCTNAQFVGLMTFPEYEKFE